MKANEGITNAIDNPNGQYKSTEIKKAKVLQWDMKIGHLVILNAEEIEHTILRIGILRALNKSAWILFRATTQHRQNNINQSKKKGKEQESIQSSTTPDPEYQWVSDNFTTKVKRSAISW